MKSRRFPSYISFLAAFGMMALTACGKSVRIGSENPDTVGINPDNPTNQTQVCSANQRVHWRFVQPSSAPPPEVDLLFVVDTSDSLLEERPRLAKQVPSFIQKLKSDTDYRIAVMLAHGGASNYSGRLYSASGSSKVLNPKTSSLQNIQLQLENTLRNTRADVDEANGEMPTYSFLRSLETDRLAEIRGQGFYRDNAALSVIFVSDENDICYSPKAHGYTTFPDYVPSAQNTEDKAFQKYCEPLLAQSSNLAELVPAKAQAAWGSKAVSLGGIIYQDAKTIPQGSEQSIGHGILELVQSSLNHVLIDLASSDYSAGLAKLGEIVSQQLELLTHFVLDGDSAIRENTISVTVDNQLVDFQYDTQSRNVTIGATSAGQAGSVIDISACKK
jgi:hypothetical protein